MLALLALCLALRVLHLLALPIFFDESEYARAAQIVGAVPGSRTLLTSLHYGAPPFFTWLAAPFTRLWSDPLLATRLASAAIGTTALPSIWICGRTLWGASAGLLAALLYALCPFVLFYNRLALLDGLVAACGAGALFYTVQLSRHGRARDAMALGTCLAAGMLTKIFAVSMLLLPVLAIVAAQPDRRRVVRRGAIQAALLGLVPLMALLFTPEGSGLLSAMHNHAHGLADPLGIVARQVVTWGSAIWLYLTPPVLGLALLGLWAIRHERAARIMVPWALLGSLPPVVVPGAFLAPRYFLYIAVPFILLAARGLLRIISALRTGPLHRMPFWSLTLAGVVLTAIPSVSADVAIIGAPRETPLIAFDRWQYMTGWPSGYALMRVVTYLRRQEAHGPITVVSSIYNPPGDALAILLGREHQITLSNVDFGTLRIHSLRAAHQRVFLIVCRPYGQALHVDAHILRLVLHAPNADGDGGDDLYEVVAR